MGKEAVQNRAFYLLNHTELQEQIKDQLSASELSAKPVTYPRILRIKIEIDTIHPLSWLGIQKSDYKIYWQSRDKSFEIAGVGKGYLLTGANQEEIDTQFHKVHRLMADNDRIHFLGGIRFDPLSPSSGEWHNFSSYYFFLPRFEIRRENNNHFLAYNLFLSKKDDLRRLKNELLNTLPSLFVNDREAKTFSPKYITRHDNPNRQDWVRNVHSALNAFGAGLLKKVVLARMTTFTLQQPVDAVRLMQMLEQPGPNTFLFLFQFGQQSIFPDSSPERLYNRKRCELMPLKFLQKNRKANFR